MDVTCLHCEAVEEGSDGRMTLQGVLPSVLYSPTFPFTVIFQSWLRVQGLPIGRHMYFYCLVDEIGEYPFAAEAAFYQAEADASVMIIADQVHLRFDRPSRVRAVFRVRDDEENLGFIEAKLLDLAPVDVALN